MELGGHRSCILHGPVRYYVGMKLPAGGTDMGLFITYHVFPTFITVAPRLQSTHTDIEHHQSSNQSGSCILQASLANATNTFHIHTYFPLQYSSS